MTSILDDGSIHDIKAILKRTDGYGSEIEIQGIFKEDLKKRGSGTWAIPVEAKSKNIVDGSYQATVYITDSLGRVTTQSTTFTIDNTPPVLILTKPNSKPGDETVSTYGQRLFLAGNIADKANETYIEVEFYDNADFLGEPRKVIKTSSIAPTDVNSNNAKLTVYKEEAYDTIYNPLTPLGKEGSKNIYIKITASDLAGNKTSDFYFSKDLAKKLTKSKQSNDPEAYGLVADDIYNILNGTDTLKNKERSADDRDAIKALLAENARQEAMFSLNPANSPYFTVSGMKTLTKSGKDFESADNGYFVIQGAQTLEVSVFMGSDSIELVDDEEFYVYLLECNEYGEPIDENGAVLNEEDDNSNYRIKLYSKSKETGSGVNKKTYYSKGGKEPKENTDGAYVFAIPMNKTVIYDPDVYDARDAQPQGVATQNIEIGKNYLIRVNGKDNEDNPVEPYETGYGFHLSSGGGAPVLSITEPSDHTAFYKKGEGIVFKGTAKSEEGVPEITVWDGDEKIATIPLETEIDGEVNEFNYTIPASVYTKEQLNKSKIYSLVVRATQGDGKAESSYSIWYDVDAPDIKINSIQPVITVDNKKCINGTLKINGTIIDSFDQVGSATYKVVQNGESGEEIKLSGELENSFELDIDTTKLVDKKDAKIIIEASDRVGNLGLSNTKTETLSYYVDQSTDKPIIKSSSASLVITEGSDESILDDGKNLYMRGGTMILSVSDDDSVQSALVMLGKKKDDGTFDVPTSNSSNTANPLYQMYSNPSVISHSLPNDLGVYLATVIVQDENYVSETSTPNNYSKTQFIIRVTGTGPDVTITPEKDYISTLSAAGTNTLTFEIVDEGNGPYTLLKDSEMQFNGATKESPFEYTITYPMGTTSVDEIRFRVMDKNSSFTEKLYKPKFDNVLPEVSITSIPTKELTEDTSYLFRGEMSDTLSGVATIQLKFMDGTDESEWIEGILGSRTWNCQVEWASDGIKDVFTTDGEKTVIVKATDGAGNSKEISENFVYDKIKPEVVSITETGKTTTPETINGTGDLNLTITIKDSNPIKPQVLIKQNGAAIVPSVNLAPAAPTAVSGSANTYISTVTIPFSTAITTDGVYEIEVIAKDESGKSSTAKSIKITRDSSKPVVTNVKMINEVTGEEVYYSNGKYYINNTKDTYKISGIAADNIGVDSVNLEITKNGSTDKITKINSGTSSQWQFTGINLTTWTATGATANLEIKDTAGNVADQNVTLNIVFDTEAPTATHEIDDKLKDIVFRIGDYANDAGEADVGGKYSNNTYGSALTIQIRGLYEDTENGSGVNKYYYKVFNNLETIIDDTKTNEQINDEETQIYFKDLDSLAEYVIANKTDTFSPLAVTETRNVEYNITAGENDRFNGTKITTKSGYDQYRLSNVKSNFKSTIKGFQEGKNYLVLVAEDNVGNTSVDFAVVPNPNDSEHPFIYPCYSLNVDITAPSIPQKNNGTVYSNAKETQLLISGTVSDKPGAPNGSSGIKEIVFTNADYLDANGKAKTITVSASSLTSSPTATDATLCNWNVNIISLIDPTKNNANISAKVVDNAGYETSALVANVSVDTEGPTIAIHSPAADTKTNTSITLKGSANDGNGAGINIDDEKGLTLYYTTNPTLGASAPTDETIGSWVAATTKPVLTAQNWTCTFDASSVATPGEDTNVYFVVGGEDTAGTGNKGYSAPVKVVVDRKAPSIESIEFEDISVEDITDNTWFRNKTLNVTGTATDTASGVTAIKYQIKHSTEAEYPETIANVATNGEFSMNLKDYNSANHKYDIDFEDEEHSFKVWAVDEVGNASTPVEYTLRVDTTLPIIISGYNAGNIPIDNNSTEKTVTITVKDINGSGISSVKLDVGTASATKNDFAADVHEQEVTIDIADALTAAGGGTQLVSATVTDRAGNVSTKNLGSLFYDDEKPSISIINLTATNSSVTLSGSANDGAGSGIKKSKGLTFYYTTSSSVAVNAPTTETIGDTPATKWKKVDAAAAIVNSKDFPPSITWEHTLIDVTSITTDNQNNTLYFSASVEDGSGNVGYSTPESVLVDREKPVIDDSLSGIGEFKTKSNVEANTAWFGSTTLNVSGECEAHNEGSGIKTIHYKLKATGDEDYSTPKTIAISGRKYDQNISGFKDSKNGKNNELVIWAEDKAGNLSDPITYIVKVDTSAPKIGYLDSNEFTNASTNLSISFTVSDDESDLNKASNSNAVIVSIEGITDDDYKNVPAVFNSSTDKWDVTIPANKLPGESGKTLSYAINVKATNLAGLPSELKIGNLVVDKGLPGITIADITDADTSTPKIDVNGTVTISGTASDDNTLASVKVEYTQLNDNGTLPDNPTWTELPLADSNSLTVWSANFITTLSAVPDNNNYRIRAVSADSAGNTNEITKDVFVKQDSDRPFITLMQIEKGNATTLLATDILGSIIDDDGTTGLMLWYANDSTPANLPYYDANNNIWVATGWTPITVNGTSWTYSLTGDDIDGQKKWYFAVGDASHEVFVTAGTKKPYIKYYNESAKEDNSSAIQFKVDTTAPVIDSVALLRSNTNTATVTAETSGWTTDTTDMKFNATNKYLYAKVVVTEKTGMAETSSLVCDYLGTFTTGTVSPVNNQYTYIVGPFDLGSNTTGTQTLTFTVKDTSGKTASESKSIKIDNAAPVLTISNPEDKDTSTGATGIQVNGKKTTISGTISDENPVTEITLTAKSGTGNSEKTVTFKYPVPSSTSDTLKALTFTNNKNWSAELDTTYLYSGTESQDLTLSVTAKDNFDNERTLSYTAPEGGLIIDQDTDRPVIKMGQVNSDNTGYITSNVVYGSITDDDGEISRLWVWSTQLNDGNTPTTAPTLSGTNTGWLEVGEDIGSLEGNQWTVESTEHDGDTTWYWAIADAEADTNNPKVYWTGATGTNSQLNRPYIIYKDNSTKQEDTDGVPFRYDTKSPEINKVELIRLATDLYKNKNANPKVRYAASEIKSYMETEDLEWTSENNISFGKDKALMYVKVTVFEETGMSESDPIKEKDDYLDDFLDVTSGAVSVTHNTTNNTFEYILGPYDMSKVESRAETHTLNFVATDMANKTGSKEKPIKVDNTAAITLKGISPNPDTEKTGEFTFSSEIEDSLSTISAMAYHIPPYDDWNGKTETERINYLKTLSVSEDADDWTTIPDVSTSWRIDFLNFATEQLGYTIDKSNNTSKLDDKYEDYNIELHGEKQGIYNIPVCFKVTDEVGNIGYIWKGRYKSGDTQLQDIIIKFNPNSDRPAVVITDPEITETGVLKSGNVTIKGTATDNEGISAVYIQIEKNGTGTFAESNLIGELVSITDTYKGILVSGTKNWKYPLNISGLKTNDVLRIRAIAIDSDEEIPLASAWSTPTLIKVNNTIPYFENIYVRQYTNSTATGDPVLEREHEGEIYITGENWYLEGEVSTPTSTNMMTELDFTVDNETDEWTGNGNDTTHKTTKIAQASVVYDGETKFKFRVPITSDTWSVKIRAKDNTDGDGGQQEETYNVNVDNENPSFPDMYKFNEDDEEILGIRLYRDEYGRATKLLGTGDQLLQNSNGSKFILAGKVTEEGSGFEKAVFYFKRKSNGTTGSVDRVYNVMEAHGSDNKENRANIANSKLDVTTANPIYINAEKLPVRALTLTKVSNSSFTNNEINTNLNIRVGGLVKLGNMYRKITELNRDTGAITISPEYSGNETDAEFVYGMVVDHEGEREDSDGTVNASSDDGDGIYETIDGNKNSGFNWTATFNSANLPDGPIEVHVVVFDKAGLTGHGYTITKASNNAPRITKVMLGTDLNRNGYFDYGTGEFKTFYAVKDDDNNPIVKSGVANWDLDTSTEYGEDEDGNPVYWKVKSGIAAIPEFVGGTGPFYWQMSRGNAKISTPATISSGDISDRVLKASGDNEKIVRTTTEGRQNATWSYSTYKVSGNDVENSGGSLAIEANDSLMTSNAASFEDKIVYYSFTFWDSTEDCTPGTDTGYTILNAKVKQDLTDTTAPVTVIKPFEWTGTGYTKRTIVTENDVQISDTSDVVEELEAGETLGTSETTVVDTDEQGKPVVTTTKVIITPKNSLYGASKTNGHIELEADVKNNSVITGTTVGTTPLGDDAKVSGKITFHGTAYDETRLSSIWFKFDGLNVSNGMTGGDSAKTSKPTGYAQAAWYNNSTASWEYGTSPSTITNGWEIVVSDTKFDQTGHYVDWYLSIDTAKITSQVGIDKALSVVFMDAAGETSATTASDSGIKETSITKYNKPSYSMDVVPYISGITTEIHSKSGLKDSNIRSAKGYYSVIFGEVVTDSYRSRNTLADDFIAVHGFNLNPSIVRIVKTPSSSSRTSGIAVTPATSPTNTSANGTQTTEELGYTTFWAKNDIANSGYLEVFVKDADDNYIRTLNNINNNDSHGTASYSGTSVDRYKNAYNREADYDATRNVTLTDDRYILMWDMHKTNTKNGYYPVMIMDKDASNNDVPVFGYVDSTGRHDADSSVLMSQPTDMHPQRRKFNADGSYTSLNTEYLVSGTTWDQMAMAKDEGGRYHHVSVYNRSGATMGYYYESFAKLHTSTGKNGYDGRQRGSGYEGYTPTWSDAGSNNAITLDGINADGLMVDRYLSIKLIAKGNSKTGAANVYQAYYDDKVSKLIFRQFKVGSGAGSNSLYNGYGSTNLADNTNYARYANGRNEVAGDASKFYDFGIGKNGNNNNAVFIYYDFGAGRLKLKYTSSALNGSPTQTLNWTSSNLMFPDYVGQYVSMAVDGKALHIAAFDQNDSNLVYIYVPDYTTTATNAYTSMTVDAAGSVGNWTSIKIDKTANHTYTNKPIIAYYNSSETGGHDTIKLAIPKNTAGNITAGIDSKKYTSDGWEYMTIPSVDPAQGGNTKFQQVCLDFDSAGNPVVGYLATNLEFGKQKPEATD